MNTLPEIGKTLRSKGGTFVVDDVRKVRGGHRVDYTHTVGDASVAGSCPLSRWIMKEQALRKVIHSALLSHYKLPKACSKALSDFERMRQYMANGGKAAPNYVRLNADDFAAIDSAVRRQSDDKFNVRTVTYNGLPLIKAGEEAPSFKLEAVA